MRGRRFWHANSKTRASLTFDPQASCLMRSPVSSTRATNPEIHALTTCARSFNLEPMIVEQRNQQGILVKRVINHKFDAYPKLNTKIQEHYDSIFEKVKKHKSSGTEEASKMPLPFGFGAFRNHRSPTADGKGCVLQRL